MRTLLTPAILTCSGLCILFAISKFMLADYRYSAFMAICGGTTALIGMAGMILTESKKS